MPAIQRSAADRILVSRFPDAITPGALPILPDVVSVHPRCDAGGFIVYRWFGGPDPQQSPPAFVETIGEALDLVPAPYALTPCPAEFAIAAYRLQVAE